MTSRVGEHVFDDRDGCGFGFAVWGALWVGLAAEPWDFASGLDETAVEADVECVVFPLPQAAVSRMAEMGRMKRRTGPLGGAVVAMRQLCSECLPILLDRHGGLQRPAGHNLDILPAHRSHRVHGAPSAHPAQD